MRWMKKGYEREHRVMGHYEVFGTFGNVNFSAVLRGKKKTGPQEREKYAVEII
jgi:hypothetical protein